MKIAPLILPTFLLLNLKHTFGFLSIWKSNILDTNVYAVQNIWHIRSIVGISSDCRYFFGVSMFIDRTVWSLGWCRKFILTLNSFILFSFWGLLDWLLYKDWHLLVWIRECLFTCFDTNCPLGHFKLGTASIHVCQRNTSEWPEDWYKRAHLSSVRVTSKFPKIRAFVHYKTIRYIKSHQRVWPSTEESEEMGSWVTLEPTPS